VTRATGFPCIVISFLFSQDVATMCDEDRDSLRGKSHPSKALTPETDGHDSRISTQEGYWMLWWFVGKHQSIHARPQRPLMLKG
jgi:hypothetical protein